MWLWPDRFVCLKRCASGCWSRQRARIETVFSVMKSHMGLEHSRHRFFKGFISCVVTAYVFRPNNPDMRPWKD